MTFNKFFIPILAIIYILHSMPMFGYRYPATVYAAIVIALFLTLLFYIGYQRFVKILPIFIIPLLDVFIGSSNTITFFQGLSNVLQLLILPMLALYLYKVGDVRLSVCLFIFYLGINLITCYTTYTGCLRFPMASRELAMGNATASPFYYIYLNANIGGFNFVYMMVLFLILSICTIKNYKQLSKKYLRFIFSIVFFIGIILAIIAAEYTTAILISFVILLLLFEKRKFNFKRIFVLGGGLLLAFWLFKPLVADGLMTIADNVESLNVSHRLTDLSLSIEGKHTSENSDLDARGDLYMKSISSFINCPIGNWNFKGMGGHSYIFDALAKYGLLGLLLMIISFRIIYANYVKPLQGTFIYGYAVISFLICLVLATLNPKVFTDFMLFVLPLYALLFSNKANIKKYSF